MHESRLSLSSLAVGWWAAKSFFDKKWLRLNGYFFTLCLKNVLLLVTQLCFFRISSWAKPKLKVNFSPPHCNYTSSGCAASSVINKWLIDSPVEQYCRLFESKERSRCEWIKKVGNMWLLVGLNWPQMIHTYNHNFQYRLDWKKKNHFYSISKHPLTCQHIKIKKKMEKHIIRGWPLSGLERIWNTLTGRTCGWRVAKREVGGWSHHDLSHDCLHFTSASSWSWSYLNLSLSLAGRLSDHYTKTWSYICEIWSVVLL